MLNSLVAFYRGAKDRAVTTVTVEPVVVADPPSTRRRSLQLVTIPWSNIRNAVVNRTPTISTFRRSTRRGNVSNPSPHSPPQPEQPPVIVVHDDDPDTTPTSPSNEVQFASLPRNLISPSPSLVRRATSFFSGSVNNSNTDSHSFLFRFLTSLAHSENLNPSESGSDEADSDADPSESAGHSGEKESTTGSRLSRHISDSLKRRWSSKRSEIPISLPISAEGDELATRLALLARNSYTASSLAQTQHHSSTPTGTPTPSRRQSGIGGLNGLSLSIPEAIEFAEQSPLKDELSTSEKLALLIGAQELTVGEEEEIMVMEMSAGLWREGTVILGVMHLTSHRLTFHASLPPPTSPGSLSKVLTSGPVYIHFVDSGIVMKRRQRVWLELTNEMISAYPGGAEDDRVRPLYSYLLSAVKKVHLPDPEDSNQLRLTVDTHKGPLTIVITLDTEESAVHWRLELSTALFELTRKQNHVLSGKTTSTPDENGITVIIPLGKIISSAFVNLVDTLNMLSVDVPKVKSTSLNTNTPWGAPLTLTNSPAPLASSPPLSSSSASTASSTTSSLDSSSYSIHFCIFEQNDFPKVFLSALREAREREEEDGGRGRVIYEVDRVQFSGLEDRDEDSEVDVRSEDGEEKEGDEGKGMSEQEVAVRDRFALGMEGTVWMVKCDLYRSLRITGLFIIHDRFICFWQRNLGSPDKLYRFSVEDIRGARPRRTSRFNTYVMVLEIYGRRDLSLDFYKRSSRDAAIERVLDSVRKVQDEAKANVSTSEPSSPVSPIEDPLSSASSSPPSHNRLSSLLSASRTSSRLVVPARIVPYVPRAMNVPRAQLPHIAPRHFVCLTIGSRGDVQPYIALAVGLMKEGHRVTIVTHEEYKAWIESWGVGHRRTGGDPAALMKLSVEHKMFSPQFFKESLGKFRQWLDDLLLDSWNACQDADVLIESPSAMAGVHIAEALKIPYFRAFTMPWSRTSDYPHAFLTPPAELSAAFNYSTYVLFDNIMWQASSGQINRWRRKHLHLKNTDISHLAQTKIPFIYNFSPSVVPKPLDWKDSTVVSGYWFLDNAEHEWTPPPALEEFMAKARRDGKHLVYIGFGSITVPDPKGMTRTIVKAVLKSDVRAILSKGWSARLSKDTGPDVLIPPECYSVDKIPHDWLFPRIDAACHHGGAGTTGASLRAGIPTIIKPWFGDQFFWAQRVQKLGAGIRVPNLNSSDLADALKKATTDRVMKEKAAVVGEKIRMENGVHNAIEAIYTYLGRAAQDRTTLH